VSSTDNMICNGETATLTLGGGNTYSLNGVTSTPVVPVSPSVTTIYTVHGDDSNSCVNSATLSLTVSECVGIMQQTLENDHLVAYPNPNNGEFIIKTLVDMDITVVNELGQVVEIASANESNDHVINIRHLTKGVYFLIGKANGNLLTHKVIVMQ